MSKKNDDRKNIIIVGGGMGGAVVARSLSAKLDSSKYNLILINTRSYAIIYPATLRVAVSNADNLEDKVFPSLDNVFHNSNGTFLKGKVRSIQKNGEKGGSVLLESGERISFAVLVLSTGSIWTGPIAFPEDERQTTDFIENGRTAFQKAQSIVIAGGGAVGNELAGEIKDIWPWKTVTIVQGDSALLNAAYPEKLRARVENRIRAHGVDVILNDFVDTFEVGPITNGFGIKTRNGVELKADLVVSARGPRPNTEFIASSLGSSVVNPRGYVKIRPTFQLLEHSDVFALGDIIDWPEQKQLAKTWGHAGIVAANVEACLSGRPFKEYKGSSEMIAITVGKNAGVTYLGVLWGLILGDWVSRMVKSRSLLVDKIRASIGQ